MREYKSVLAGAAGGILLTLGGQAVLGWAQAPAPIAKPSSFLGLDSISRGAGTEAARELAGSLSAFRPRKITVQFEYVEDEKGE